MVVAGGTAAGQLIAAASSPILSRLYSPNDFGVLAVYASILSIITAIASLRFEIAIPLPEKDEEAIKLLGLSLLCIVTMTAVSAAVLYALCDILLVWLKAENLRSYLWLLPIGLFFSGMYQALSFWCIRKEEFAVIARTKFIQSLSAVIVQLFMSLMTAGPLGLIVGQIIGLSSGVNLFVRSVKQRWHLFSGIKLKDLSDTAKKYRNFFKYESPQVLINVIGQNIPQLMLATSFGITLSGFYLMAQKILGYPIALVGNSFRQVYYQKAVIASRDGKLYQLARKSTKNLSLIILLPLLLTIIVAPDLFAVIFGDGWRKAGEYARYIAIWSAMGVVNIPANAIIPILGVQRLYLIFEIIYFLARVAAAVTAVSIGNDEFAIILIAAIGVIFNVILIFGVLHIAKLRKTK